MLYRYVKSCLPESLTMLYHRYLRHLISIINCTHTSKATIATGTKPYTVYLTLITLQLHMWKYVILPHNALCGVR